MRNTKFRFTTRVGFSLIEIVVGLMVGGVAVFGGMKLLEVVQKKAAKQQTAEIGRSQINVVNSYLRSVFEGGRSFQGLAFRLNSSEVSVGPGFIVKPNVTTDSDGEMPGACAHQFDRITVVLAEPTPSAIKLTANATLTTLRFKTVNGTALAPKLAAGNLVVLSSVTASEALYNYSLISIPIIGLEAILPLSTTSYLSLIESPPRFKYEYVPGDYVRYARMISIGGETTQTEPCLAKLTERQKFLVNMTPAAPRMVTQGLKRFRITPILDADTHSCAPLHPAGGPLDLNDAAAVWGAIRSDATGKCYSVIKSIRFDYALAVYQDVGRGIATSIPAVKSENDPMLTEMTGFYEIATNR